MKLKLTHGFLVGDTWHEAGDVIEAEGKYAETLVRQNAAVPVEGKVEEAVAPPRHPEKGTGTRQR